MSPGTPTLDVLRAPVIGVIYQFDGGKKKKKEEKMKHSFANTHTYTQTRAIVVRCMTKSV